MTYLKHYGVKGQKWGVRRGPPYPIEDKVLPKGTRVNSVSNRYANSDMYKKTGKWMYTYRPEDEWDNAIYKGPFAAYLIMSRGAQFIREHEYETTQDLMMPTKKERMDEFKSMFNDKKYKKHMIRDVEDMRRKLVQYNVGGQEHVDAYKKLNVKKLSTDSDYKVAYEVFSHAMENVIGYRSTNEYAKRMASKYDAMVDDNNQGIYNRAHDPIIIFKADKFLKDVSDPKNPKYLSMDEINNNYVKVESELRKKGETVKL